MGTDIGMSRRELVAAMGASVAAASAIVTSTESAAQNTTPLKIVDFHNHYMGPSLTLTNLASVPTAARPTWEKINSNLQSQSALLASIDSAGITRRFGCAGRRRSRQRAARPQRRASSQPIAV